MAGYGRAMVLVKDVGAPADICARYGIPGLGRLPGQRPHPDGDRVGGDDRALAPVRPRRRPRPRAQRVVLELRDDPRPARPLGRPLRHRQRLRGRRPADRAPGWPRATAWRTPCATVLKEMDGFFTLLVTTRTQFAVVRDSFACKPAVIAETGDYVAMASEYQALAGLPGIADAEVFEPMPEEIHLMEPVTLELRGAVAPARSTPRSGRAARRRLAPGSSSPAAATTSRWAWPTGSTHRHRRATPATSSAAWATARTSSSTASSAGRSART